MARIRFPIFTGGLNESARADLINDAELQESTNYYVNADGKILKRTSPTSALSLPAGISGTITRFWIWESTFLPKGAGTNKGYVILAYTNNKYLYLFYYKSTGWVIWNSTAIFSSLEEPKIAISPLGVIIVDGRDNHLVKEIIIDSDGNLIYGNIGMPSPLGLIDIDHDNVKDTNIDSAVLGTEVIRGSILFYAYVMVDKLGNKSNPSPIAYDTELNYISRDEDYAPDKYWKRILLSKLRTIIADMSGYSNLEDRLDSFEIYRSSSLYTESESPRSSFELIDTIPITDIMGDNDYVDTSIGGQTLISYENDINFKADDVCITGGVTFLSNANSKIEFPFDFDYYLKTKISNKNNQNFVGGVFCITIKNSDLKDKNGNQIFTWADVVTGTTINSADLPKLRFIDGDNKTFLPVDYYYDSTLSQMFVWVRIPYVAANINHNIYLLYAKSTTGVPSVTGSETDFRTPKYGKWLSIGTVNSYVFAPLSVRNDRVKIVLGEMSSDHKNKANLGISPTVGDYNAIAKSLILRNIITSYNYYGNTSLILIVANTFVEYPLVGTEFPVAGKISFFLDIYDTVNTGYQLITDMRIDATNGIEFYREKVTNYQHFKLTVVNAGTFNSSVISVPDGNDNIFVVIYWSSKKHFILKLVAFNKSSGTYAIYSTSLTTVSDMVGSDTYFHLRGLVSGVAKDCGFENVEYEIFNSATNLPDFADNDILIQQINMMPYFSEEWIGCKESSSANENITFDPMQDISYKVRKGMIRYSHLNKFSFGELDYIWSNGANTRIIPAPSYLRNGNYLNSIIIFGLNYRQRFILNKDINGWNGQVEELLIDEKTGIGLHPNNERTLIMVNDSLCWLDSGKFYIENRNGLDDIFRRQGVKVLDISNKNKDKYIAWYNSIDNQIVISTDATGGIPVRSDFISYVYSLDTGVWTKFKGLVAVETSQIKVDSDSENSTLLLDDNGNLFYYPNKNGITTSDVGTIKTKKISFTGKTRELIQFKIKRIQIVFAGDPTVKLKVYHPKMSSGYKEISVTGLTSGKWKGVLGGMRGYYFEITITNAESIESIDVDGVFLGE